ncbi:MAG: choice-of-anchor L domain-containing protein [Flavobacteriales bacterium]|nr:choice-of-anchor L domain-containing protein [Flavobacteriales bacterium]
MRINLLCACAFMTLVKASAQVTAWPVGNIPQAIADHLNGPNVIISNVISQVIDPLQVGFFNDSTASIGLDSGIVISTGVCYGVIGPNNIPNMTLGGGFFNTDPDLAFMSLLYANVIGDPAIIQMDLVPAGDTLQVQFVFGSEEYDEYACSDKDDRMGMFLSGPGLAGPFSNGAINMALLPVSGLPVTVNTLNRGFAGSSGSFGLCAMNPGWEQDTIYYINNDFGSGTQLDGYTVVLRASAVVVPGALYHLKIAIADVNDANFDSAIFLPEGAIRCTDVSTSMHGFPDIEPLGLWFDELNHTACITGFGNASGSVHVEIYDPSGRLLQRSAAVQNGSLWTVPMGPSITGMAIIRATRSEQVFTGRVFVR